MTKTRLHIGLFAKWRKMCTRTIRNEWIKAQ
nr:MAG TPA: hypothetical protein [Caudoviricetes sp.]DAV93003.1 MAG TPA: hypothetical protein [Bacteriophage sp.]